MNTRSPNHVQTLDQSPAQFDCHFIDGAYLQIHADGHNRYRVDIQDLDEPDYLLQTEIAGGEWVRSPQNYFVRWGITVYDLANANQPVFEHQYACQNKRVYIAFESKALGDTLAWFPAVEAFRQLHQCQVICSTFLNSLFKDHYPEIEFVEPGETVHELYAMYRIGLFYSDNGEYAYHKIPSDFRELPMAQAAYDILGLAFVESKPRLLSGDLPRPMNKPYVCIGFHASCQAKYWNNSKGWDELIRFIRYKGYSVVLLSNEGKQHMGNRVPNGVKHLPAGSLETVIQYLQHAKLFIGVGSGLSWLAWALDCPTCLISGFSLPYTEMQDCIRIFPQGQQCTGCFNRYRLDPNDWNWCPDHQNTPRMFECSRQISSRQVIEALSASL